MSDNQFLNIDKAKHGKLLEFLASVKSVDLNGKNIMQTPDGEFVDYILMEEQYFIDNWLAQFALGNVSGKNYFDQDGWNRLTDGYTKGVIVINENKDATVLIRKFIDMDLNVNQQAHFDHYTRTASHAAHIPNKDEVDSIMTSLADILSQVSEQNPDYDTLTALIPYEYYLSKGIDPTVMKQVIYIRDNFKYKGEPISTNGELITRIESILYKNSRGETITKEEVALINEVTDNQFEFNNTSNKVDTKDSVAQEEKPFDPLSD